MSTRLTSMDVDSPSNAVGHPFQTRKMDKTDIRDLRRWHLKAALRARAAGFGIVYVYATHSYLLANFLDPRVNTRSDENEEENGKPVNGARREMLSLLAEYPDLWDINIAD